LTSPGLKNVNADTDELSLIRFPVQQLFEEKLDEFDLIIFDQFTRRSRPGRSGRAAPILQPYFIQNIAQYVEKGGALLIATGPGFAGDASLFRSPLAAVLPARPTGKVAEYGFKPMLNDKGRRHPVTAPFFGGEDQSWGEWFRIIESNIVSGDILMNGPADEPLLVIENVGEGRVAMLMSDQAWLWSRGYDGGGPYSEMFRRLAHWLLGEPDLDAEKLTARADGDTLLVERSTLSDSPQKVIVQKPDGTAQTVTLKQIEPGLYRGTVKTAGQGAYRLNGGDVSTITAIGTLNPKEFSDLTPTSVILDPLVQATGGQSVLLGDNNALPSIERVRPGKTATDGSISLTAHEEFVIKASKRTPLAPGLLFFALAAIAIGWAWRREGQ
jgi:uncharacterized membrane protein